MKILFCICSLRHGGRERQLVELVKGIKNHKNIILELVVMSRNIHYTIIKNLNIKTHYLIRKTKKDPRILIQLYRICKEFMPDIIHTWDSMTSIYAVPIAKKLGINFINGMIRDAPQKLKPFRKAWIRSKLTFPFSDVIVSNSHAGITSYRAPSKKCVCIHNGFDIKRINTLNNFRRIKNKYGISTEKVVGIVGSFSNKKDYEIFISSAQMILEKMDNVTFLAIGDGENLEKIKNSVKPEFKDKIKFLGKQKDVESIVNIFNIGILTTDIRFHGEGISNSIMEYMVLGKPVVATNGGGTNELVLNGKTGFLVNPRDKVDLSKKVIQLLENNKLATKMGNAGKERIHKVFGLEKMTSSYVSLFQKILNET